MAVSQLGFLPEDTAGLRDSVFWVLHLMAITWLIFRLVDHLLRWYIAEMAGLTETLLDERVLPFIRRLSLILIIIVAIIMLLSHFEVDVSAMVTTLGIGSLAIALAAQNTLSDTISGLVIITDRPFSLGDRVEIRELDTWGDVVDIGLRSTRIRTRDNRMVVVPNGAISKSLVVNHSVPSTVYRVQTHVGVDYGTDIDRVREIMIAAVKTQDWVMHDRPVEALFIEYGNDALIFRVRCWIENYVETRRVMDKLNSCLYRALYEEGISIGAPVYNLSHHLVPEEREGLVSVLQEVTS
jgi:small-conductance mechanosensitive channel